MSSAEAAWDAPLLPDVDAVLAPAPSPRAARLPDSPLDQEGLYEGLLWAVRGLEECGRAFTRLAARMGRVEARLAFLDGGGPRNLAIASSGPGEFAATDASDHLRALERRIEALENAPRPAPAAPAEPADGTLRRELANAQVRLARLEGAEARTSAPLAQHLASLEADLVGVYREVDSVAELVAERFATLGRRIDRIADLESRVAQLRAELARRPPAAAAEAPPAPEVVDLTPDAVRQKAASVLSAELERIRRSLGVVNDGRRPV